MPNALSFLRTHRRQLRVALTIALAVFTATALYTYTRPKIYEATAVVILYNQASAQPLMIVDANIRSGIDTNTAIKIMESTVMLKRVADHLTAEEISHLINQSKNALTVTGALASKRTVSGPKQYFQITISYRDQSPELAARIATLFATEFKSWQTATALAEHKQGVEDFSIRIKQQTARVAQLEESLTQSDPISANYIQQKRELDVNAAFLAELIKRRNEIDETKRHLEERRIDSLPQIIPAEVPALKDYVEPNHPLHLGLGLLASLLLGGIAAIVSNRATLRAPSEFAT